MFDTFWVSDLYILKIIYVCAFWGTNATEHGCGQEFFLRVQWGEVRWGEAGFFTRSSKDRLTERTLIPTTGYGRNV